MAYKLGKRSRDRLEGVHPDIVSVLELAISRAPIDFTVLEGLRSVARQRQLVNEGASTTMNSRHLTGHAVDIAPLVKGRISWHWPHYYQIEPVVKQAAKDLGVDLEWGGDWKSFKDGPHWQLSWKAYPKDSMAPKARKAPPRPTEPPRDAAPQFDDTTPPAKPTGLLAAIRSLFGGGE
jgi:peptidoglycan LD-endopeptidase CwlK